MYRGEDSELTFDGECGGCDTYGDLASLGGYENKFVFAQAQKHPGPFARRMRNRFRKVLEEA